MGAGMYLDTPCVHILKGHASLDAVTLPLSPYGCLTRTAASSIPAAHCFRRLIAQYPVTLPGQICVQEPQEGKVQGLKCNAAGCELD